TTVQFEIYDANAMGVRVDWGGAIVAGTPQVHTIIEDKTLAISLFHNGVEITGTVAGTPRLPTNVLRTENFLAAFRDRHASFQGDVAEIIVYARALSPAERDTVEGYLFAKYAIPPG